MGSGNHATRHQFGEPKLGKVRRSMDTFLRETTHPTTVNKGANSLRKKKSIGLRGEDKIRDKERGKKKLAAPCALPPFGCTTKKVNGGGKFTHNGK